MDYRSRILADSPVNYWRLGESSGHAVDEIGTHNLVWTGAPTYGVGGALVSDPNTAMSLAGAAYASQSIANYRQTDQQGTIEAWIKSSQATSTYVFSCGNLAANYSAYIINATADGKLGLYINDGSVVRINAVAGAGLKDGGWHLLHVVSTGSGFMCYLDGVEYSFSVSSGQNNGVWFGDFAIWGNLVLGAAVAKNGAYGFYTGELDEVAVYDYPLSPSQIAAHYRAGKDTLHHVSGAITNAVGAPAARTVRAYDRNTGTLLAETVSDALTGVYELDFLTTDEIQRVVLANETALYNDLIDRVSPA
jgi:hypothetical protein